MEDEARYRWLADHVFPWEPEVRRWLHWRAPALSSDDISDFIQGAYAQLCSIDFSKIRNGRRFFYSVVNNLWRDQRRRSRVVHIERFEEAVSLHIDEAPSPEQRASARQRFEHLVQVVQRLPERQRAAFEGRHFAELSYREIAQRMNISEKTVEMHLHSARDQVMRSIVGEERVCPQASEAGDDAAKKRD
jgi:RNA polymerase sigma-70 factor (ECF subfamily)